MPLEKLARDIERVGLSPERWVLLVRHFAREYGPDGATQATIVKPLEIEGITFLPAVYYPA